VAVPTIPELADQVRAGLDQDQADAERHACALGCLQHTSADWHRVRHERGRHSTMEALRSVGLDMLGQDWPGRPEGAVHTIHYAKMRGTAMDPARVLAEVASKRALLGLTLATPHGHVVHGYRPCTSLYRKGEPCDCGRDERVHAVLTLLAQPYQETSHV
jgi:hypothetical protein